MIPYSSQWFHRALRASQRASRPSIAGGGCRRRQASRNTARQTIVWPIDLCSVMRPKRSAAASGIAMNIQASTTAASISTAVTQCSAWAVAV